MTDKPIPFNSGDYQNHKAKLVQDGLSKLGVNKPERHDPTQALLHKAQTLTTAIRNHLKPILKAGGWKDREALRATIATMYIQGFSSFDKEELENLCTILHLEIMMESIDAAPWGDSEPDLLSGK